MANRRTADSVREKIRAAHLIKRLEAFILDEEVDDGKGGKAVPNMSASQVNATLGLLKKIVPDLKAIEHSLDEDATSALISNRPLGVEEWQESFGSHSPDHKPH